MSCVSATSCLTVGLRGSHAVAARWDGTSWQDLVTPAWAAALSGVACTAPDACTVVGRSTNPRHKPLIMTFDGTRWKNQRDVAPHREALGAVACPSSGACLATIAADFDFASGKIRAPAGAERWDGRRWRLASTGMPRGAEIKDIDCRAASDCTAVGIDVGEGQALALRWNGSRWTRIATPHLKPSPIGSPFEHEFPVLGAVSCPAGGPCVAVGARAISRTESRTLAETG